MKDKIETRQQFLNQNIKLLPYMEITRGPSTKYNESIHILNCDNDKIINIWWCDIRKTTSVSTYNPKEKESECSQIIFSNISGFKITEELYNYIK